MSGGPQQGALVRGWPFLVGRTVHHPSRALLIPEPVAQTGLSNVLADLAGPPDGASGTDTWAVQTHDLFQTSLLIMRSFQAFRGDDPARLLLDQHSRPIRLFEGLLLPGVEGLVVLGEDVWRRVRAGSRRQFSTMLDEERASNYSKAPSAASSFVELRSWLTRYVGPADAASPSVQEPSANTVPDGSTDAEERSFSLRRIRRTLFPGDRDRDAATAGQLSEQTVHLLELVTPPPLPMAPALPG